MEAWTRVAYGKITFCPSLCHFAGNRFFQEFIRQTLLTFWVYLNAELWICPFFCPSRPRNLGVTIGPLPYRFPGVLLRWTIFRYPPLLWKYFVRFSFSPSCVKTTIPLLSFASSWFVSFFAEACFSSCKNYVKLYSLVRRTHSFGL